MNNRVTFFDLAYSDSSQDWLTTGGKLAPLVSSATDILSQLLKEALETPFNSMPYVWRQYGNEGYADDYSSADDKPKVKIKSYLEDIIRSFSMFVRPQAEYVTVTFTNGVNGFTARIECILTDPKSTVYDKILTWNGVTKRATIA